MYDPKQYWEDRGQDYKVRTQYDVSGEIDNLKNLLSIYCADSNILEVGPGYGRIYNQLIQDFPDYTMVDFVNSMRRKCLKLTGVLSDYWDGKKLPYNDNDFQVIILFSVLLHIPPVKLYGFFQEMLRACSKYIFIASSTGRSEKRSEHCFKHDYEELFKTSGVRIIDKKVFNGTRRVNYFLGCS